jgi:glutamate-1-semialdehyde 2,1-aminomutase
MATIVERYQEKFSKSAEIFQTAVQRVPTGGHQSRVVRPFPVYVDDARGALKWDADGNEIIDFIMGYGALILGHAHPVVTDAVSKRLGHGTIMAGASQLEIKWADHVSDLIPSAERVRFTASGTESTLMALRLARAFTGKRKIVKFHEHFHGWHDYVASDSGIITDRGIPEETLSTVIVADPDIAALGRILERDKDIAAVICEPGGGHWGQYPLPNPTFLQDLREVTSKHGVVMIMDEVICGFRLSKGGAQARFGIKPDLTTMAKIVAGGFPGGAVAGRSEIMDQLGHEDDAVRIAHPGTFNANPVSATAGVAALGLIANEPINERADANAARLRAGLRDALTKMEVAGHVHGVASIVHVALGVDGDCTGEVCSIPHDKIAEATSSPTPEMTRLAMFNEGVDMMGGIGFMVSAVHENDQIDRTAEAFERALGALREEQIV